MSELTAEYVNSVLFYDEETGELFWKKSLSTNVKPGRRAGCLARGYIFVGIRGELHPAHRLVWLMKTGKWPTATVDHIDRDRANNRWSNLRLASPHDQQGNLPIRKNNKSGVRGVFWNRGKWLARISTTAGRKIHVGYFSDIAEAKAAYDKAASQHFGEFYKP